MFLAKLDFSRWTKDISFVRLPCLSAEILLDQGARRCSFMEFTWAYIQLKHPQTLEIHTQSSTLSPPVLHTQSITLSPPHSVLHTQSSAFSAQQYLANRSQASRCQGVPTASIITLPRPKNLSCSTSAASARKPSQEIYPCKGTPTHPGGLEETAPRSRRDRSSGVAPPNVASVHTPPNVASVHTPPNDASVHTPQNDGSVHAPPKDDSVHGSKK
ncbi:hypothetical protein BKA61DRAFT_698271 [Leptodontidium sp. MPI-SDFR-AT-0119]|nr:hypothetical protein BKA61DRAFT_698271 [Leptodontidium sp. MPI-SDFR-AT-0119]